IGATLSQRDGYITVVDIVPGSPSWKQGDLEVNDKILKVAQGDEEPVDVVDMRLDKAVKLVRGPKDTEVRLTVQKIDGTQKTISIIRDVVIIEETYAKSMTLTDKETGDQFGYIYLPSFYANFNDPKGRRCSVDMKNEVEKLKNKNVKGIIIDLRNNTGGSLFDCIEIAGLFIDFGPVVQVKSRTTSNAYPDKNNGVVYDGPLVVMVNQSSASASEIFAAAMQDYKRAIILGTTTFGKGSVQRFEDLDPMVMGADDIKPLGSVKVTLQKFYRINGGSTQLLGVTPDIPVTSIYKYIDYGERELDNPLAWSEMPAADYDLWQNGSCDWTPIIDRSLKRMAADSFFIKMDENAKRLKKVRDNTIYPLKYKDYDVFIKNSNAEADKFKNLGKDTLNIDAVILSAETSNIEQDTTIVERNKKWHQQIITDRVLLEAMKVCEDMELLPCFIRKQED
ncbi:MAG: carboxy terminal-processing peptidase, partial [Bacteroidales bacterium]|nr:carboxy terminal-processing peptidase [Bacteroidales bacterium]